MTTDEKIQLIGQKMMLLSNNLDKYRRELDELRAHLDALLAEKDASAQQVTKPVVKTEPVVEETRPEPVITESKNETAPVAEVVEQSKAETIAPQLTTARPKNAGQSFEEKVGGRWLSIIGIVTLVLGIAVGVKYAIDQDLINETTRLVLGYLAGAVIFGVAAFYKKKYHVFSGILLSGAMAVMYFTTYAGYAFYHFYPPAVAFLVMAVFTGFTVFAAHIYNLEVVALVGLVGGYAVPPLLSTGSGEIQYMFGFMLILNTGILVLSFNKYWKFVNHTAYGLTWIIFISWMAAAYNAETYFARTMLFATAFYLIFYASFISYKVIRSRPFSAWDVVLVMSNSFVYFGVGYNALDHDGYEKYQGLFCVLNAITHLGFAMYCRNKGISDKPLFHFIIAMVITFITIAIPVQLSGNYVTLTWLCEVVILLWLARRFGVTTYRNLGYILSALAFCSLVEDWSNYSPGSYYINMDMSMKPFLNKYFLTGACAIAAYFAGWQFNRSLLNSRLSKIAGVCLLAMFVLTAYITFACEIDLMIDTRYFASETTHTGDYGQTWQDYDSSWKTFGTLWILMYTSLFVSVGGLIVLTKLKDRTAAYIAWGFTVFAFLIGTWGGFTELGHLMDRAINYDAYSSVSTWNYNFRYVYLLSLILLVHMIYRYRNSELVEKIKPVNTWLFHIFIVILLSSELSHIMTVTHLDDYYHYQKVASRMGYTILWGLYSMCLIIYGITRKRKLLRIIALSLFGVTLLKLAGDALTMTRGYQLIVFMSIGVILLVVSFMYQKFKPLLFGDENESTSSETEAGIEPDPAQ